MGLPLTGCLPPPGGSLDPTWPKMWCISTEAMGNPVVGTLGHVTHPVYRSHPNHQPFGNATAGMQGKVGRRALRTWEMRHRKRGMPQLTETSWGAVLTEGQEGHGRKEQRLRQRLRPTGPAPVPHRLL